MIRPARLVAGGVVAGLVALAIAAAGSSSPAPATVPAAQSTSTSRVQTTVSVAPQPVETLAATTSARPTVASDPLVVTEAGLAGWGRFAVSGDLAQLAPWFDPAGPQFELLAAEAPGLVEESSGSPPYAVTLFDPVVEEEGDTATIGGRVVWARTGEPSQSHDWRIVLRQRDGAWSIWTVVADP